MRTIVISALAAALAGCAGVAAQDDGVAGDAAATPGAPNAESEAALVPDGNAADAAESELAAADELAPLPTPPAAAEPLPPAERDAVLAEVDAYLSRLDVLTGSFFQIEPTGVVSQGKFWIVRPGRMRFEYDDPHPFTLVADGATYTVWDRELDDVNTRVPLRETPLNLFLKRDVDLARDADVLGVVRGPGEIAVSLKDRDERVQGTLTMVFAQPALELRRFITTDEAGDATEVVLTDAVRGGNVDPALFLVREPRRRAPR